MRAFLIGMSLLPLEYMAYKMAGLYLSAAKDLGANTFRPKDVMGPYITAFVIATGVWITLVVAAIEYEKAKKEQDKAGPK
jgi:hypothetical protein